MSQKTLCLAPECYKLWAIRPGLCFLYDNITIDERDYNDILQSADKSSYNMLLARNVERLRMEGILKHNNYDAFLPSDVRIEIHEKSKKYIANLSENKRLYLAKHAHDEYQEYLKSQLLFCQPDEPKFITLSERLEKVKNRIILLHADGKPNKETDETLKRVTAKSLAGSFIVSQMQNAHLYDTSEYRPFIDTIQINDKVSNNDDIKYNDRSEDRAVDIVAAIVLNKRLPDITVYDDNSLTTFLHTRDDLAKLRNLIKEVLERYHALIKADPGTAYNHLKKAFDEALLYLNHELKKIEKRTGILWKITEILASIKFSIIKPFLKPLHEVNLEEHRRDELAKLSEKDKLLADLLFVFDKVRFGNKRYAFGSKRKFPKPKETEKILWGQGGLKLPWYERKE